MVVCHLSHSRNSRLGDGGAGRFPIVGSFETFVVVELFEHFGVGNLALDVFLLLLGQVPNDSLGGRVIEAADAGRLNCGKKYFFDGHFFDVNQFEEITLQGVRNLRVSLGFVLLLLLYHRFSLF